MFGLIHRYRTYDHDKSLWPVIQEPGEGLSFAWSEPVYPVDSDHPRPILRKEAMLLRGNRLRETNGDELDCQFVCDASELHARISAQRNQSNEGLWLFAIIPGGRETRTQIWQGGTYAHHDLSSELPGALDRFRSLGQAAVSPVQRRSCQTRRSFEIAVFHQRPIARRIDVQIGYQYVAGPASWIGRLTL
ncbi:hypothetical protein [Sphingobium yanoikuyae]|uniref:hypothetical protein n=1 Tax=Sphingobium yanoikuyae TaxID=13690 RepID=UPI00241C36BD|nr:hypothetical protein [Sphingobium yanoikuyae]